MMKARPVDEQGENEMRNEKDGRVRGKTERRLGEAGNGKTQEGRNRFEDRRAESMENEYSRKMNRVEVYS